MYFPAGELDGAVSAALPGMGADLVAPVAEAAGLSVVDLRLAIKPPRSRWRLRP